KFNETQAAVYFSAFFTFQDREPIHLTDVIDASFRVINSQIIDYAIAWLKRPEQASKLEQIANELSQLQATYIPESFSGVPAALPSMFKASVAFTGTTFNRGVYPPPLNNAISTQEGALGQITAKIHEDWTNCERSACHVVHLAEILNDSGKIITAKKILDTWLVRELEMSHSDTVRNLRMLVDAGSFLVNQELRNSLYDIAVYIMDHSLPCKYIEYAKDDFFYIVNVDAVLAAQGRPVVAVKMTDPTTQRPPDKGEIFYLIDAARAVGTDPATIPNATGVITIDPLVCGIDYFLQGLMRLRELLDGQCMSGIMLTESAVACDVRDDASPKKANPAKLLTRLVRNTASDVSNQKLHMAVLVIKSRLRAFADSVFDELESRQREEGCDPSLSQRITSLIKSDDVRVLFTDTDHFSVDCWDQSREWQNAADILGKIWIQEVDKLTKIGFSEDANADANAILAGFSERYNEVLDETWTEVVQLVDGAEMLVFRSEESNDAVDDTVEQQLSQQAQCEVQAAREMQNQVVASVEQTLQALRENFRGNVGDRTFGYVPSLTITGDAHQYIRACSTSTHIKREWMPIPAGLPKINTDIRSMNGCSCICTFARDIYSREFSKKFFITYNLLNTHEISENSIFSAGRKDVTTIAIICDPSSPDDWSCFFLAHCDAAYLKTKIHSDTLRNCWLYDFRGQAVAHHRQELPLYFAEKDDNGYSVAQKIQWLVHFFNANVDELTRQEKLTAIMLRELGMPTEEKGRKRWLGTMREVLIIRSDNAEKTARDIANSYVLVEGNVRQRNDAQALAEMGLSMSASPESIMANMIAAEDINITMLTAFVKHYIEEILQNPQMKAKIRTIIHRAIENKSVNRDIITLLCTFSDDALLNLYTDENVHLRDELGEAMEFLTVERKKSITSLDLFKMFRNAGENLQYIASPKFLAEIFANIDSLSQISASSYLDWQILLFNTDIQQEIVSRFSSERITQITNPVLLPYLQADAYKHINAALLNGLSDDAINSLDVSVVQYLSEERLSKIEDCSTAMKMLYAGPQYCREKKFTFSSEILDKLQQSVLDTYFTNHTKLRIDALHGAYGILLKLPDETLEGIGFPVL
ncbi:MAG: hypothetical protein LBC42_03390, partial [Puniceicoccales bacterium]|nr:hypothetical protein [Puniceicoccales bacterium]